jgi:hypothetical protein
MTRVRIIPGVRMDRRFVCPYDFTSSGRRVEAATLVWQESRVSDERHRRSIIHSRLPSHSQWWVARSTSSCIPFCIRYKVMTCHSYSLYRRRLHRYGPLAIPHLVPIPFCVVRP